jgi:hypothetical protein
LGEHNVGVIPTLDTMAAAAANNTPYVRPTMAAAAANIPYVRPTMESEIIRLAAEIARVANKTNRNIFDALVAGTLPRACLFSNQYFRMMFPFIHESLLAVPMPVLMPSRVQKTHQESMLEVQIRGYPGGATGLTYNEICHAAFDGYRTTPPPSERDLYVILVVVGRMFDVDIWPSTNDADVAYLNGWILMKNDDGTTEWIRYTA